MPKSGLQNTLSSCTHNEHGRYLHQNSLAARGFYSSWRKTMVTLKRKLLNFLVQKRRHVGVCPTFDKEIDEFVDFL
jgi:hypothetical protein